MKKDRSSIKEKWLAGQMDSKIKNKKRLKVSAAIAAVYLLSMFAVPYGDFGITQFQMYKLCKAFEGSKFEPNYSCGNLLIPGYLIFKG